MIDHRRLHAKHHDILKHPREVVPKEMQARLHRIIRTKDGESYRRLANYEEGDYVNGKFPDEATGVREWMWVHVRSYSFGLL